MRACRQHSAAERRILKPLRGGQGLEEWQKGLMEDKKDGLYEINIAGRLFLYFFCVLIQFNKTIAPTILQIFWQSRFLALRLLL